MEFLLERGELPASFQPVPGLIFEGDKPVVKVVRYSIFEIDGRKYHFAKGNKVFIFKPRPEGKLPMFFKALPLLLVGRPGDCFVVSWRKERRGEILRYGVTEILFDGKGYYLGDGSRIKAEAVKRGLRITRMGKISLLEEPLDRAFRTGSLKA